jgi:hypothetical protein
VTGNEVQAILIQLAGLEATMVEKFNALAADNTRGESVHADHEARLRALETVTSEGRGAWKLMTAGGAVGAGLVGAVVLVLRSFGV